MKADELENAIPYHLTEGSNGMTATCYHQSINRPAITAEKSEQLCRMRRIIPWYTPALGRQRRPYTQLATVCDMSAARPSIYCPVHDATSLNLIPRFHDRPATLSVTLIINLLKLND